MIVANCRGLRSGGGQAYLRAIAAHAGGGTGIRWRFLVTREQVESIDATNCEIIVVRDLPAPLRILSELFVLPRSRAVRGATVLLGAGGFGLGTRRLPCMIVAHNLLYFTDQRRGRLRGLRLRIEAWLARACVRRSRTTIAPSASMAAQIAATTGTEPVVLPFGPGRPLRVEPGRDGVFRIVHQTGWGPHKRLAVLLDAIRLLASRRPDSFHLTTSCDPRTPFAASWEESAVEVEMLRDPDIARYVTVTDFRPTGSDQVIQADAAVMPSDLESFCFPLAEALAAGLPVVAADVDYARELCGDCAFYATPCDAEALATQLICVLDGERPPLVGAEWRQRISWDAHVRGLERLCPELSG